MVCRTEQAVGANISVSYKFKLFSRLCKTIEREGAPLADSLVERLAQTLVQPDVKQAYSSLCFFYGTQLQGPAAPEGDHQGSSLSGTAPCCVEELVEKWHQYRTHTKTSVPATHFSGWVVLKASSDMLAGGTGKSPSRSLAATVCLHVHLYLHIAERWSPDVQQSTKENNEDASCCRLPRVAVRAVPLAVDTEQP